MSPDKIELTLPTLNAGADNALLIGHKASFEYDRAARKWTDRQTGISYEIVLDNNEYIKIFVRVSESLKPPISMEELRTRKNVRCTFKGFKAGFYKNYKSGEYQFTASAEAIILIDDEEDLLD